MCIYSTPSNGAADTDQPPVGANTRDDDDEDQEDQDEDQEEEPAPEDGPTRLPRLRDIKRAIQSIDTNGTFQPMFIRS